MKRIWIRAAVSLFAFVYATTLSVAAQGVTSGAITGTVADQTGKPLAGAQVEIVNRTTGYRTGTLTRANGLYLVQGLEVGGPYTVRVSSIGFTAPERTDVYVSLSQATRVDFKASEQAVQLGALEVVSTRTTDQFSPSHQGVSNVVTDSMLRRIPSLSRDILDLVRLTPQVSKPQDVNGGPSAGGQFNRFNNFTVDGASAADRFNLNASAGAPGSAASARLLSVEAVKEFRVALTPTDVRQGNFTGMLVNAVTKNGTNEFRGGGTVVFRNEGLAGKIPGTTPDSKINQPEQSVKQFGFSVGGPIIKDRLHFFLAPEFQQRSRPAAGNYVGGTGANASNISPDSIEAIRQLLSSAFDIGSKDAVTLDNPLTNLFGRLDFAISDNHRLVVRQIINRANDDDFFRNTTPYATGANTQNSGFRMSSNMLTRVHRNASTVVQLYSNFRQGWSNEVIAGYNKFSDIREVPVTTPEIAVAVTPTTGGTATGVVTVGTEEFSPKNELREKVFEIVDNLTIPLGAHTLTFGARAERDDMFNFFAQRLYGVWNFPSIAALRNRTPSGYSVAFANSGNEIDIGTSIKPALYSMYAQDQFSVNDRLTVTYGLRADLPSFVNKPVENNRVFQVFADSAAALGPIHTSNVPKSSVLWSPRVGFNYDVSGDQRTQVRGNAGLFTGPPPFVMIGNAYGNNALGLVTLTCGTTNSPAFTTDIKSLPHSCANQPAPVNGSAGTAGINVNDPNFKYPQYYVASFGVDKALPFATVLTVEGVYRHAKNGILIRDLNLKGPRIVNGQAYTDRNGRVLYADTFSLTSNAATNNNQRYIRSYQGVAFTEGLIQVTNQSEDYNYSVSAQLRKRFSNSIEGSVSYTHMRSEDVQSLTSDRAVSNFRNGRQIAGSHDDIVATTSIFDRPHRLLAYGSFTLPTKTDISLSYEGISGVPILYTANADLNGDLVSGNDPIYIPNNATDANEIRFQNATDGQAFEKFISDNKCIDEQRGQIMERNSCRTPFQHRMDLSIRQSLPRLRGQGLALQLDVFNFLNLVNRDWGQVALPTIQSNFPQQNALNVVGRTPGPINQSYAIYTFNSALAQNGAFQKRHGGSNEYQMQLTLRYQF